MARVLLNIKHRPCKCFVVCPLEARRRGGRSRSKRNDVFNPVKSARGLKNCVFKFVQSVEALIRHEYAVFPGASRIYYKLLKENETIIAEMYCQRVGVLTQTRECFRERSLTKRRKFIPSSPRVSRILTLSKRGIATVEDWNRFSSGGI